MSKMSLETRNWSMVEDLCSAIGVCLRMKVGLFCGMSRVPVTRINSMQRVPLLLLASCPCPAIYALKSPAIMTLWTSFRICWVYAANWW